MTSTHKHHIISIQCPSHKCLPEKSCLHCLRILIMSWLFKDPAVIMKVIMSWLFKDPTVTVTWYNFNHAQSNSKKWLHSQKDQIAQNEIFSRKTIKFLCTYYPFLFCKILNKFLEMIQSYQDVPFSGTKLSICPEQNFLIQPSIITFIYLLVLFIVQNLQKILTVDPKL